MPAEDTVDEQGAAWVQQACDYFIPASLQACQGWSGVQGTRLYLQEGRGPSSLTSRLAFCQLALTWVHYVSVEHTLSEGKFSSYIFFLGTEIPIAVEAYMYKLLKKNYCPGINSQGHLVPGKFCTACFKYILSPFKNK